VTVQVINMTNYVIELSLPIGRKILPRETKIYDWVQYDEVINVPTLYNLISKSKIIISNADASAADDFVSQWNQEPKLRLSPYVLWVDTLGFLRMKSGNPLSDLDGTVIGPGGGGPVAPHGPTHEFTGSDPIPRIEVLEGAWSCTVVEQIGDSVFESAANTVRQSSCASVAQMPSIGIVIQKPTPTTCVIARSGEVSVFSGLTVGEQYYVSKTAGQISTIITPTAGQVVQYVGYARNTTTLVVQLGLPTIKA